MEIALKILQASRANVLELLANCSLEQLNTIPEGFNNNLVWNAAHVAVTHQLLVYGLSGVPLLIPGEVVQAYRKGSRPERAVDAAELEQIKTWLHTLPAQMAVDYEAGKFQNYKPYQTSYGVHLETVDQAIGFNQTHEGLHLGYMMAMRKMV